MDSLPALHRCNRPGCFHTHRGVQVEPSMDAVSPAELPGGPMLQWLRAELARYRYKPNVRVEVYEDVSTNRWADRIALVLKLTAWVEDSRGGGTYVEVTSLLVLDGWRLDVEEPERRRVFREMLHGQLQSLELHELDEWFRYDGELVNDPHAPRAKP